MPHRVVDLLVNWKGRFGRHRNSDIWNAIPLCFIWILWRERNVLTFEGLEWSSIELKFFLCNLYE